MKNKILFILCYFGVFCGIIAQVPQSEKDALITLYNNTNGSQWLNNSNWNSTQPVSTWFGVTVQNIGGVDHVTNLVLNNNNLVGSLPESIQNLNQVESMYFNNNHLIGSLVDVSGMSVLSTFSIHNNSYTFLDLETHFQVIQSNIENFIYAPMNQLENEIIEDLTIGDTYTFTMPNVAGSNVSYQWYKNDDIINGETGLSYTISNAQLSDAANYTCKASSALIPNLTIDRNVIHVYGEVSAAERNALINFYYATGGNNWNTSTNWNTSAPIYEWHGVGVSGHTVTSIQLAGNNLSGVIPNQIDDLQNLEYLRLSFNNITGSIPESLGNLSNLEYFSCYGNQMSGSLPSELGDLNNIKNLHLTNNQFSGNIPQELGNLQNLEFLWLDNNAFTGNIPQELENLQSLKRLRLNNNQLSGTVPSELGNLTTLIDLNLSENQLNGELTSLFSSMDELNFVNLGANNFYGTIDLSQNFQLSQCYVANTNISTLRVNNMNNTNFSLNALNNPNLTCVFVDDVTYSLSNWINTIDASATFVETEVECDALYTYIPDDNFEQALIDLGLDNILDDRVATHQISNLTTLDVDNKNISDMTGIEDFVSLTQLICWNNPLSSIDVSNLSNLVEFMVGYGLNSLDVTQNPQLEILYCPSNQLTTLDLSNNPNLRELACTNNLLSTLDLSNNPNINYLSLGDNQLSTLDVSHLSQLIFLSLSNNQLTDIDITQNTSLNSFYVDGNSFTNIDVSMLNQLYRFKCQDNDLLQLNVKNGNNNNFILFNAENNPSLNCIVVDDVNYSNSNWLSVDSNVQFVDSESMCESLSIETLSEESILDIYPNPIKDVLNLELKTSNVVQKIVLYDNLGRIVKTFSPTKMALDFRDVPSGIYVLNIQIRNGSLFEKVIKE